jgi:hypothetical protein
LSFFVAKILGSGKAGESHAQSCYRRFRHLAVNESGLIDNARLFHFEPQVVSFTRALSNSSEDGNATVFRRDVVDQFLNDDGLSDARSAE